jgi:hypothetical protein
MLEIASGPTPLFVTVTAWAWLVVPTAWLPNVRPVADKLTAGNGVTVTGEPGVGEYAT